MYVRKLLVVFLIVILIGMPVLGQSAAAEAAAERAKKQKELDEQIVTLLDRTIADIGGLKLAQNRAVVNALAGDIYWRYDPKRSRELFRNSAAELINYQAEYEREKLENVGQPGIIEPFDVNDPRLEILNLIGSRDPELGLELMAQTRPPAIAEAMARIAQQAAINQAGTGGATSGIGTGGTADVDRMRGQQEISLEQNLTMRAAMNDPEKLVKSIKESLAKNISFSLYGMLQRLTQLDEKKAADLGEELVTRIESADLTRSQEDLNGAIQYLQLMARPAPAVPANASTANRPKQFAFTAEQARDVALKLASTFLQMGTPAFVNNALGRALPSIEKLAPEKAAMLKQRDAQNKRAAAPAARPGAQQPKWNPNDTPEAIIAAAGRITDVREKNNALQAAAGKIGQIADEARARRIIDSIPDERIRTQARERFESNRANRLLTEGKLEESKAAIAAQPNRRTQILQTVQLAIRFYQKNTEKDRETAADLMNNAKGMTNPYIENEDDLTDHMSLINGYGLMEPETAFRMIEPIMDQFNEIILASAVLSRYNKRDRSFKKGEMTMRVFGAGGGMLPFRYIPQIQMLARVDLERMSMLAERIQRNDARTLFKLNILQGYQRGPGGTPPPPPIVIN